MSKKKEVIVMTPFGPVPFEGIKQYFSPELVNVVDYLRKRIQKIEAAEAKTKENAYPDIVYYIERLAEKKGWNPRRMAKYLDDLTTISPSAVFSILLKEVAIELDKKYEDHISDCKEVFVVSLMDGRIHKVPRAHIKNFRNFAAFRTEEDARSACKILRNALKNLFSSVRK